MNISKRSGWKVIITLAVMMVVIPTMAFAATYVVRARPHSWDPAVRRIPKGNRISWRNPTARRHDVRAYGGNWTYRVVLQPGERASRRFGRRGVYKYRCTFHSALSGGTCSGMCGVIRVRA
jgi:plastocyanin